MTGARARRLLSLIAHGLTDADIKAARLILTRTAWEDESRALAAGIELEALTGIEAAIWIRAAKEALTRGHAPV
jgi:hypothetical protein